jgi:hypothetical protein
MDTPVIVALVSSATSAAVAVCSLMTVRMAKARALEAEELAKRSEQVRVKGLDAGAMVLMSLAEFMIGAETAIALIKLRGELFEEDLGAVGSAALAHSAMRRCVLENAIYLTGEIVSAVESLVSNTDLSPDALPTRLDETRRLHSSLVSQFREVYLSEVTVRPHNLALQLTTGSASRS